MRRNVTFRSLLKQDYLLDYDNNRYKAKLIGSKEWIDRNYRTTHYADGTPIQNLTEDTSENLSTSWDNIDFHLFGSMFANILIAISYSGTPAHAKMNDIACVSGDRLIVSLNLHLISGFVPSLSIYKDGVVVSSHFLDEGVNDLTYNITADGNYAIGVFTITNPTEFSAICEVYKNASLGWFEDTTGAYCWYENDITNKSPYGALYNYPALVNAHGFVYLKKNGVRQTGWRVPSIDDWDELFTEIGDQYTAGRLKETGTLHWDSPNTAAENLHKMKIVGSGERMEGFFFIYKNINSPFWTTTPYVSDGWMKVKKFVFNNGEVFEDQFDKNNGLPVRLVRNPEGLDAPVATDATSVTDTSFNANWNVSSRATGYRLDVSLSPTFATFVTGYEDLDVGYVFTYPVIGLDTGETYYYRVRAYNVNELSVNSNRISVFTASIYTCCATYNPDFESHSADHDIFLSCGILTLLTGTIGDYYIEWRYGSISGPIVFTSGETADPGEVQIQHPFTDEVVFAGTLYPTIKYIYVDGIKYTSVWEVGARYSPDLLACLDPIIVDFIQCDTVLGVDPLYNYHLTYNNGVDLAFNKSRTLGYSICGPGMKYLAVEFNAYQVADQIKIYYCTLNDLSGTLLDNYIHGQRDSGGAALVGNLYPASYPTNPRIALYGQTGTSPLCFITNISSFTYAEGDYLRIEITGAVYEPSNSNTNWYLKLQSLDTLAELFIADTGLKKIVDTPAITYLTDPDCRYEVSYNTEDDIDSVPARTTIGVPDLYKYLWFWRAQYSNPSNSYMENPVRLGMNWKSFGSNYGLFSNTGFSSYSNLDPGEQISLQKSGDDYIFTFTDNDDYNKMKADIVALKAHSSYITWSGLTDIDPRYYATWILYFKVADNVGDTSGITYYLYLWFGNTITYDDGNMKITWTCQVPTNNLPDPGDCNNVDTIVANTLSSLTARKNVANYSTHSHIRSVGWYFSTWPYYYEDKSTNREFLYAFTIEDAFVDGLVDMAALGFCKGIIPRYYYANMWVLPHYMDKVTFLDYSTHDKRLYNWKLERKTLLRTDICADTAYEEVYSSASIPAPTATAASSIDHYTFNANWNVVASANGYYIDVATDSGFTSFVVGYENLNVGNVLTHAVTVPDLDTTYYYRVRANNDLNISDNSNTITLATTALDIPVTTTPTVRGNSNFTATWGASHLSEGYYLDVSTDPAFGSFVSGFDDLDVGNVTSYSVTGLPSNDDYYFRVRAYGDSHTSGNSNTSTINCPASLVVSTRGSGAGVSWLTIKVSANTVVTLIGSAKFYSNIAGSADESSTWIITTLNTLVTRYIKCTSGTAELQFNDINKLTGWGHATIHNNGTTGWGYWSGDATTNLPSVNLANWNFPNCVDICNIYPSITLCSIAISQLSANLEKFASIVTGTITGVIADIPETCTIFGTNQTNTISGNITDLPSGMIDFYLLGSTTMTGDIANLPSVCVNFSVGGSNTISGDVVDLPNLGLIYLTGVNTIHGELADLPSTLANIQIEGRNTLNGPLSDLGNTIYVLVITGYNTISGNLDDTPTACTYFQISGYNTITGGFTVLSHSMSTFILGGYNTCDGAMSDLPTTVGLFVVTGYNTVSGTIAQIPTGIGWFDLQGSNTLSGDLGNIPTSCYMFILRGANTASDYSGKTWNLTGYSFAFVPSSGGLSAAEIDQFFIDIDACSFAGGYKTIVMTGANAAPTSTSASARTSLAGKGVSITTN